MAMTPQSALAWLADEIQSILASLVSSLEDAKRALDTSQTEQYANILATCEDKAHSIAGALEVAHNQPLVRYVAVLKAIIGQWRESPSQLTHASLTQLQAACWSLHDFLKAVSDKGEYLELSLFAQYQQMGTQVLDAVHPMDLWQPEQCASALAVFSQAGIIQRFEQELVWRSVATERADKVSAAQLDVLMLGLIRYKQNDVADQLQVASTLRMEGQSEAIHSLFGTLLSAVIDALGKDLLSLDMYLKRFLLGGLEWLKGQSVDLKLLVEQSIFFCFTAWQKHQANASPRLIELAQLAQWQHQHGADYREIYFRPEARYQLLLMEDAIDQLQVAWSAFCNASAGDPVANAEAALYAPFEKVAKSLEVVHPSAQRLNQTFYSVVTQHSLASNRDIQVEVATTLLMLKSMVADASILDGSLGEQRFESLNQRLSAVCLGKPSGPLEPWMTELEQRDAWSQAITSSTEQIGQKLAEIESIFKHIWDHPSETEALALVPEKLQLVGSVAQSLGLDRFAQAVKPLQQKVEALVGKNQVMDSQVKAEMTSDLALLGLMLTNAGFEAPIATAAPSALIEDEGQDQSSMTQIFLEETLEVIPTGKQAVKALLNRPDDADAKDTLRRAFHTLKGSARIVGLTSFGEAAWMLEKHLHETVLDGQPISAATLGVCDRQLGFMSEWTRTLQTQAVLDADQIDWQLGALATELQNIHALPSFTLPPADFLDLPAQAEPALLEALVTAAEITTETQIKTVGDLEISIPLYQAYLNETDEWSRQLALALSEWSLDANQPIPSQALSWAHALAGSSATVGFSSCAGLAKLVERAVELVQTQGSHSIEVAKTLSLAADDIRRLLHQFAAGFVKEPDLAIVDRLETYLQSQSADAAAAPAPLPVTEVAEQSTRAQAHDEEMRLVFQEETAQLVPELGAALRAWEKSPSNAEYKTQALRVLHTLKGSARLVGEQPLAQRAHDLESQIEQLGAAPTQAQLVRLLSAYDQLQDAPEKPVRPVPVRPTRTQFTPVVPTAAETIRIQSSTVDRLVNQTGEIMTARARMESEMSLSLRTLADLGSHVQRLRDQLRELELQTESQMQSRRLQVSELANSFDPLELDRFTRTQELTRFMAEALSDVSSLQRNLQRSLNATEDDLAAQLRQTRDLQRHLLRTRMVEFDSISERLHRLVRMSSQEVGKQVELTISNGRQELDRSVLERVLPAFEHILRNAVVHGIEAPAARAAKGKSEQGLIDIELTQQSNDVIVVLRDNGRGLDKDALLAKAKKLLPNIDPNTDPAELIFMSGLTTASEVSELAGRGIGLDVVRAQVQALGGRVQVEFAKDVGTTFKLILPLTMAVTQIVLVRTGSVMTGIPSNLVISVVRAKIQDILEAQKSGEFKNGAQSYPFHDLNQLLHYKTGTVDIDAQGTLPVMLLQSAGQIVALHVDEVLGNQEVMIKNLGTQLAQLPGLSGMTVLPAGAIVLIYNPVALASVYGSKALANAQSETIATVAELQIANAEAAADAQQALPLVLVVDDSITMRRVLQRLLQREGYRVALAADGRQALDSLRLEKPAMVLSDVEMPRMNGFELLESIRANDKLRDLPVVMITSRIADKHRDHAKALGANEYLGKPYSEEELIEVLSRYASKTSV